MLLYIVSTYNFLIGFSISNCVSFNMIIIEVLSHFVTHMFSICIFFYMLGDNFSQIIGSVW